MERYSHTSTPLYRAARLYDTSRFPRYYKQPRWPASDALLTFYARRMYQIDFVLLEISFAILCGYMIDG